MLKMKKLLTILLLLITVIAVRAANITNLVIKHTAGNETIFSLDSNPVITFDGDYMDVTNDFTRFSIPFADIDHYYVSNTTDAKDLLSKPQLSNGQVTIKDLPRGTKAYVCSLDGKVIKTFDADSMGTVVFNLRDLTKGTYIISAANTRIKVANK